jgi:aldehyde dehydrogenase (NAD+)
MREYGNFINGKWVPSKSGKVFENRNPSKPSEVISVHPLSTAEDVNEAVEAAKKAFKHWSRVPAPKRAEIIRKATEILLSRKEELARLMTMEMGKPIKEARGDVQEAIDTGFYAFGEGRRLFGVTTTSELPNKTAYVIRRPVGVVAAITPWNFPMAIPSWKLFPALVAGNTVVLKPASDAPASAAEFVKALQEAGIPDGVVNLVTGSGEGVGEVLASHPDVRVVSFTGSSVVGARIAEIAGKNYKKVALEMGGKNPIIVMPSANLELAVDGVLWGAFGTTGQRCTATSRLILHEAIYDKFMDLLLERVKTLKVDDPLLEDTNMGPLVNEGALKKVELYVRYGLESGAKLVYGGKRIDREGYFFEPTIFTDVDPNSRLAQEEIFGPVLSVFKVRSFEEAIELANNTKYGLSSSIYTNDIREAMEAIELLEAGITYINAPTIGAETHLPFGGVKQTGNGHREGGWTAFEIFTELKTVYIDYSGRLQRAQIDTWEE